MDLIRPFARSYFGKALERLLTFPFGAKLEKPWKIKYLIFIFQNFRPNPLGIWWYGCLTNQERQIQKSPKIKPDIKSLVHHNAMVLIFTTARCEDFDDEEVDKGYDEGELVKSHKFKQSKTSEFWYEPYYLIITKFLLITSYLTSRLPPLYKWLTWLDMCVQNSTSSWPFWYTVFLLVLTLNFWEICIQK